MRVLVVLVAALPLSFALLAHVGERASAHSEARPFVTSSTSTSFLAEDPVAPTPRGPIEVVRLIDDAKRALTNDQRPRVIPRDRWDDKRTPATGLYAYRGDLGRRFTHVVIHHSDFEPASGPDGILRYHLDVSGFSDIAYHFVVEPDGRIYEGRDLRYMGAHAGFTVEQRGARRAKDPDFGAIGIVLDGYFEHSRPGERQLRAALTLVEDLRRRFSIPRANVIGHGEVADHLVKQRGLTLGSSPTSCPGSALLRVLRAYRDLDEHASAG